MIIKESKKSWGLRKLLFSSRKRAIVLIVCLLGSFSFLLKDVIIGTIRNKASQEEQNGKHKYDPRISKLEKIEIAVSDKDFEKIKRKRQEAFQQGILVTSSDSYVPAKIRHNKNVYRAKIRLKGDWVEHLQENKWSFRISIKDGDALFGMREFSIQHPRERSYVFGWLFHRFLREEGILALRVNLIDVTFNGEKLGLYYMEEHFDKLLIEHNKYREGPIVKFDESLLWEERLKYYSAYEPPSAYHSSAIDVFQPQKILSDPRLKEQFIKAYNLLYGFRQGELRADQVFHVEKLARFYALCDLLGAYHAVYFHNLRFYYNPVTSLLEPIGFDADAGVGTKEKMLYKRAYAENPFYDFERTLFRDHEFLRVYLKEIDRISQPHYLEGKLVAFSKGLKKFLNLLYVEFPDYQLNKTGILENQKAIYKQLHPVKGAHAYLEKMTNKQVTLRVGNLVDLPLELLGVSCKGRIVYKPPQEYILPAKTPRTTVQYQNFDFKSIGNFMLNDQQKKELGLAYKVLSASHAQSTQIYPLSYYRRNFVRKDFIRQEPNVEKFDFINTDEERKIISFQVGEWSLSESLIIPKGYRVIVRAGTTIDLLSSAKIVSYSPVFLIGEKAQPVQVISSDGKGHGIAVMNASGRSKLEYVLFNNLEAPKHEGWELTGAVTFYESPVDISDCKFVINRNSDDFLNIIRSDFMIERTYFAKAYADALDVDFSTGQITDVTFDRSGNDALDFSGSSVTLKNIEISNAMDKGISAGEASSIDVENIKVTDSKYAFVSKDSSVLMIDGVEIINCKVGFVAFQKKPEFGPATLRAENISSERVHQMFAKQSGSKLILPVGFLQAKEQERDE